MLHTRPVAPTFSSRLAVVLLSPSPPSPLLSYEQVYSHVGPLASPLAHHLASLRGTRLPPLVLRPVTLLAGKISVGGVSLEIGAPAQTNSSGSTTQAIALTTFEHCVPAGQTLTVLASFHFNDDGLLSPCDQGAFIYKGTVHGAQRHLQDKAQAKQTWQYICAVRQPPPPRNCFPPHTLQASAAPLIAIACYQAGSRRSRL